MVESHVRKYNILITSIWGFAGIGIGWSAPDGGCNMVDIYNLKAAFQTRNKDFGQTTLLTMYHFVPSVRLGRLGCSRTFDKTGDIDVDRDGEAEQFRSSHSNPRVPFSLGPQVRPSRLELPGKIFHLDPFPPVFY